MHVVQLAEPNGATWFAAHATQAPSIIACPEAHLMQDDLSSEGAEPSSHVVQLAEPYGATWFAAHATQVPSVIAHPGLHVVQCELSAFGAVPGAHAAHRSP